MAGGICLALRYSYLQEACIFPFSDDFYLNASGQITSPKIGATINDVGQKYIENINKYSTKDYLASEDIAAKNIIAYFPGNGEGLESQINILSQAPPNEDYAFVSFPYPGRGKLGNIRQESDLANAAVIEQIKEWGKAGKKISLIGFSMGANPALQVAANPSTAEYIEGVALINPFTSLTSWINDKTPQPLSGFLNNLILRYKLDNVALASKVKDRLKVMITSSTNDQVTPHHHREALAKHFKNVDLKSYDAQHNNIFTNPKFGRDLSGFLFKQKSTQHLSQKRGSWAFLALGNYFWASRCNDSPSVFSCCWSKLNKMISNFNQV